MFARIIVLNCMNINRFCELVIVYYFKESFNMMFKRIFFFIFLLLVVFSFSVNATEDELYSEQYNSSGVAELFGQLFRRHGKGALLCVRRFSRSVRHCEECQLSPLQFSGEQ